MSAGLSISGRLALACGLTASVLAATGARAQTVMTGDANLDGRISIADPLAIRRWFFDDGGLDCLVAADVDGDGVLTFEDPLALFSELFLPSSEGRESPPELRHFFYYSEFPSRGTAGAPPEAAGTGPAPLEALGCEDASREETGTTDEVVRFGEVAAPVGGRLAIPVYVHSTMDLDALQLVIRFDPDVFVPDDVLAFANFFRGAEKLRREVFAGTYYEDCGRRGCEQMLLCSQSFLEDGVLVVTLYSSLFHAGSEFQASPSTPIVNIVGTVRTEAVPGQVLTLEAEESGFGPHALRNELVHRGASRFLSTHPTIEAVTLSIIPDISIFSRGDANLDDVVDLSDVVRILGRLFLGDPEPFACDDAADVNDDGELGISDALATLLELFVGGFTIPPPYPGRGVDPTPDSLSCSGPSTTAGGS